MSATSTPNHYSSRLKRPRQPAAARLTKPFRSPLIRSSLPSSTEPAGTEHTPGKASSAKPSPEDDTRSSVPNTDDAAADVSIDELYMQYTALSRQLTQMRQSLDTAQQALNILKNGQQVLMQTLIDKWKGVIRDAAEELFDDAKARVEQNGGLTRSTRRPNFEDNAHDKLSDEQKDMLQYQQEEDKAQARKYGLLPSTEPPDGGEESTSFTMATMLRQMDVDLQLVGYDEKEQRFVT